MAKSMIHFALSVLIVLMLQGCTSHDGGGEGPHKQTVEGDDGVYVEILTPVKPVLATEKVVADTDDPAVWIHPEDPSKSLILGPDKGEDDDGIDGGLYVFDLSGKIVKKEDILVTDRPNNVDVEYGFKLGDETIDIAILTLRDARKIRVYKLPELEPIDNGGFPVFEGEAEIDRRVMGVGIYKRQSDDAMYAILSRKEGPSGTYLWQYQLEDAGDGSVSIRKVRDFGLWSGHPGEIEAITVDDELGYVYCSDELLAIRKYHADPDHPEADQELAIFGIGNFMSDREGISIYDVDDKTGYILVSDQQSDRFQVFRREGEPDDPHLHTRIKIVKMSTSASDGSESISIRLNENFPNGLFIAMSNDRTFQLYSWSDIAGEELKSRKN